MDFTIAAYTDIGIARKTNQDSLCVRRAKLSSGGELLMAVVCDGMGGLEKGELASAVVVEGFGAWFDSQMYQLPRHIEPGFQLVREQWGELIQTIHHRLISYSQYRGIYLGTTLCAMLACRDRYLTVNIGDSRIYELKDSLLQLTEDQSLVAQEIAAGRITENEARHHPQRNILTQCVGDGEHVEPVFTEGRILGGGLYLLCTDGFVHEVSNEELLQRLNPIYLESKAALSNVLVDLTEMCKERGEQDNITVIAIKACETSFEPPKRGVRSMLGLSPTKQKKETISSATLVETALVVHTKEQIP